MVAEKNLSRLGLQGIVTFIRGLFDDTLETVLNQSKSWDYVFIDGHHDGDATWRYLRKIYPKPAEVSLVILDDIRWSGDMLRVWEEIIHNGLFQLCVDFDEVGVCVKFPSEDNFCINVKVT
jgi:predicted O-methyltransferase YrrM